MQPHKKINCRGPPNPRQGREEKVGGEKIGGGGDVPRVITYQTVGSDGHIGWTIKLNRGGASPKLTPANHWRQGPQKGVSEGWPAEDAPEVLAGNSSPPQELQVPEKH